MRNDMNEVNLTGTLMENAQYSHMAFGEPIYRARMAVRRKSGAEDYIILQMGMHTVGRRVDMLSAGEKLSVSGQLRGYQRDAVARTILVMHVLAMREGGEEDNNLVSLNGLLMRAPVFRITPQGREICDLMVRAQRGDKWVNVPVIAFGRVARWASMLECGERVKVRGRLQSREYTRRTEDGTDAVITTHEVAASWMALEDAPE